ncbi:hypothetical protein ACFL13_02230 [Patescibacteria group bacterium]
MDRTCPKCNLDLTESESNFCLACGHKLEDELVTKSGGFNVKYTNLTSKFSKSKLPEFKITKSIIALFLSVLLVVIGVVGLEINSRYIKKPSKIRVPVEPVEKLQPVELKEEEKKQQEANVVELDLEVQEGDLWNKELTSFVPVSAHYFVESHGLTKFSSFFKNINPNLDFELMKDYFVGFADIGGVGLVFEIIDPENFEMPQFSTWYADVEDKYLMLTNNEDFLGKMRDSYKKAAKNISHHQKYSGNKALLPKKGKLVFMAIEKPFDDVYQVFSDFELTQDLYSMLNALNQLNYDKFVIK